MAVVMARKGYPGPYEKGTVIKKLEDAEQVAPSIRIFHAGPALDSDGKFIATGGRVLGVTAKGSNLEEAHEMVYQAVEEIDWSGGFHRRDIGCRVLHGMGDSWSVKHNLGFLYQNFGRVGVAGLERQ